MRKMLKKFQKTKSNRGYSLIVLVIAIVVIIILAAAAITSLTTSRQRTEMMNFIFDMNSMEEKVQSYYVQNGSLPTDTKQVINIEDLAARISNDTANDGDGNAFKSQLSEYDNENYYYIDVNRLGGVALREPKRSINGVDSGYIVNEGSLKVYVEKGVKYKQEGISGDQLYYTLTYNLVNGQESFKSQEEEIKIAGNPQTWVAQGELRVILPRQSEGFGDWKFKWDFGPKTAEELEELPARNSFNYGDKLIVKRNGVYSILAVSPQNEKTVLNINVTRIDDIAPTYKFIESGDKITLIDNETGLKNIQYKNLTQYKANVATAHIIETDHLDARQRNDFFLMDGSGDNLLIQLGSQITEYANRKKVLNDLIIAENNGWADEEAAYDAVDLDNDPELQRQRAERLAQHNDAILSLNNQLELLDKEYPYIADIDGNSDDSRLVLYFEDYGGNGSVVGNENSEFISTRIAAKSYNISLAPLGIND